MEIFIKNNKRKTTVRKKLLRICKINIKFQVFIN